MSFTFHEGEFDREDVAALLELHFNAMRGASPPEACHVLPASSLEHPSIHLIVTAGAMGITRLSLETGSTPDFAGALRLYKRTGFTRSATFGGYPGSLFTSFFSRQI